MPWTHKFTRRNQTQQKKNRRNEQTKDPTNTKTLKSFLAAIQYFAKFILNLSEKKNRQHETITEERDNWDWTEERNSDFNKIKQELTSLPCRAHYNGNEENITTTNACKTGLGVALWQKQGNGEMKTRTIRQPLLK